MARLFFRCLSFTITPDVEIQYPRGQKGAARGLGYPSPPRFCAGDEAEGYSEFAWLLQWRLA